MKAVRRVVFRRRNDSHAPLKSNSSFLEQNVNSQLSQERKHTNASQSSPKSRQQTKSQSSQNIEQHEATNLFSPDLVKQPLHQELMMQPSNDQIRTSSMICRKTSPSEKTITTIASSAFLNDDASHHDDASISGDEYFDVENEDEPNYVYDSKVPGNMRMKTTTSRLPSIHSSKDAHDYGMRICSKYSFPDHSVTSDGSSTTHSSCRALKRREVRAEKAKESAKRDRKFWKKRLTQCVVIYGGSSIQTANCLLDLGLAHMTCKEYAEALSVFKKSVRIIRKVYGNNCLQIARALDCVGMAACKIPEHRQFGLISLNEALHIRFKHLGPNHVDSVDTLNNMAGCYVQMRQYKEAKEAYEEILYIRSCIFGRDHASVAVTAELLGNVYYKMRQWKRAVELYDFTMNILLGPTMALKPDHPMVLKLQKEIQMVERVLNIEA